MATKLFMDDINLSLQMMLILKKDIIKVICHLAKKITRHRKWTLYIGLTFG